MKSDLEYLKKALKNWSAKTDEQIIIKHVLFHLFNDAQILKNKDEIKDQNDSCDATESDIY